MREEFIRTAWLIGEDALDVLEQSRVGVFGLGGVGSYCAEALARAGVGELLLVDRDVVETSNLNRQLHALVDSIGMPKAELMEKRVKLINPSIKVEALVENYRMENADQFFQGHLDYIVDAIDDVGAKVDLIKRGYGLRIPLVSCMGAGNRLDPTRFKVGDLSVSHGCPLARTVRKKLRLEGITKGIKVVFSDEQPLKSAGPTPGSISFVPPVAGLILASVVVRGLIGERRHG